VEVILEATRVQITVANGNQQRRMVKNSLAENVHLVPDERFIIQITLGSSQKPI
jgi:hypothetical protein